MLYKCSVNTKNKGLLCARHCSRSQEISSTQNKQKSLSSVKFYILVGNDILEIRGTVGRMGGSVSYVSNFSWDHDLTVLEFKSCIRLCTDSSEPGACFGFSVSCSLCPSPAHALSLSQKQTLKQNFFLNKKHNYVANKSSHTGAYIYMFFCFVFFFNPGKLSGD